MTLTAAVTLAVGIGSATAIFSVAYALLLKPMEYPASDRLVRVWELTPERERFSASGPDYLDFVAHTTSFEALGAFAEVPRTLTLTGAGVPSRIDAVAVSASLFDVLGVPPARGRAFLRDEEDRDDAEARRILLGHALWRDRFGANPAVIGSTVTLDREPYLVTGVMPEGFDFPFETDAWVPMVANSPSMSEGKMLGMIGRLKQGVSIEDARADLARAAAAVAARDPGASAGWSADAVPLRDWLVTPRFRDALFVLLGAVGCLLLLACANVANLLMAQASRRRAELRMRVALGARRGQLARLMFVESALLASLAAGLGLLVAMWAVAALRLVGGSRIPQLDEVALHAPVIVFALAVAALSCVVFGVAPALHASRTDLGPAFDGLRVTRAGRRTRALIVAIEMAMAVVLLTGAGMLAVSFARLTAVDPGFNTASLLAVPVEPPGPEHADAAARFYEDLAARLAAIPGVEHAGATTTNPFRQSGFANTVTPEDAVPFAPESGLMQAGWRAVTPGYFDSAGVPILAGRAFTPGDDAEVPRVAIVSRSLADRLWPGGDALGSRFMWGGLTGRPRTIVGIAGDIRDFALDADPTPMVFVPHAQVPVPSMTLLVRTPAADAVTPRIRAALGEVDPALSAAPITRVDDSRARAVAGPRFNTWLIGAFAAIAAALAATGIYAMLAFAVGERRREIAVRLALGARPGAIVRMVVGEGLRLSLAGLAAGLVTAFWLTRYLASLLFDVSVTAPWAYAAAGAGVIAIAVLASALPARQASRIDPVAGLRT